MRTRLTHPTYDIQQPGLYLMVDLSAYPINRQFPAEHPDLLQLYSLPTPNGVTGKLIPSDPAARYETLAWVFWQMAAVGPMFGQLGFFHKFAGKDYDDKRPRDRYLAETKRLLGVLETRLADRAFIMGQAFTIADISLIGWVHNLVTFYEAGELVDYEALKAVPAWVDRCLARPAVARGLTIPARF